MAQQQMTSLFGPTPQDLLRQQQQADQELAMRQAQLGPGQGLMYQAASAGQRAGRNIAGLFGVEDPRLKEASAMQELKTAINTQWDGTDPVEAYKIMAKEAARLGLTQQSLAAAMQVKQAEEAKTKTGLETRVKEAQINKYVADKKASEARAESAGKPKTPEFVQLQNELSALETRLQSATDEAEADALLKRIDTLKKKIDKESSFAPPAPKSLEKVGVSTSGQIVYLNPNTNKQVIIDAKGEQVPYSGAVRESSGTTVNVNTAQESEFLKQLGKTDADTLQKARVLRQSAIGELENLNAMAERNAQGVTSGSFASGRVGVANFFNTIGLLGPADVQKLANSENFIKQAGDLVLSKIKPLGTQPSSSDRDFILKIIPQLENSPQARAELITFLQNKANKTIKEVNSMEQYALTSKKGLSGYVPTIPLTISPQPTKDVTKMTDQELIDAYKSGRR